MKQAIRALAMLSIIFVFACGSENTDFCLSNQQSVQAGFYSSYATNDKDSTVRNVIVYSTGVDSITYDTATVSKLYLPLNLHKDTSQFIIEINTLKDTITFVHNKELNFVSGECGFIFSLYLDTVYHTNSSFIDSIVIINDEIIYNENFENVKMYLY